MVDKYLSDSNMPVLGGASMWPAHRHLCGLPTDRKKRPNVPVEVLGSSGGKCCSFECRGDSVEVCAISCTTACSRHGKKGRLLAVHTVRFLLPPLRRNKGALAHLVANNWCKEPCALQLVRTAYAPCRHPQTEGQRTRIAPPVT